MDQFFHVRMIIGIILGLSITQLLKGGAKFIQHPGREKVYRLHILWVFYVFLIILHFWWWEFGLHVIKTWNFPTYFFVILYAVSYYITTSLLFPDDIKDYKGFKEYFFSRKSWFFSILTLTYVLDIFDSVVKKSKMLEHLGVFYYISIAIHIICCILAMRIKNERFHYAVVITFIVVRLLFIYDCYFLLQAP